MMTEKILEVLRSFGLTKKEGEIFLFLSQYGKKPASTIAKHIGDERTNTYKTLLQLVKKGFISQITKDGVKLFFVADKHVFEHKLAAEIEDIETKKEHLLVLQEELDQLEKNSFSGRPNIVFYEGIEGIKNLYEDILNVVLENEYKQIKFFASNTLENRSSVNFLQYAPGFLKRLEKHQVHLDIYLGNGISILEEIMMVSNMKTLADLPASNSAIQLFLCGDTLYVIIFKDIPYGLKIASEEYASIMHFFFKKVQISERK